jgi:hypothetical protein
MDELALSRFCPYAVKSLNEFIKMNELVRLNVILSSIFNILPHLSLDERNRR